ncbi:MAG: LamG-like jellyroll fold domain-containing protein [Actinomycetota bacterium]
MARPTVTVDVAFGKDPLATPGVNDWTDITSYVRELRIKQGRSHELSRSEAGTAELQLANLDRRFDPSNAASPYSPNLLPMKRIRVRAAHQQSTRTLFTGFVDGWPQTYPPRPIKDVGDAEVTIRATDAFKVLNQYELVPYSNAILSDAPVVYWPFNEPNTGTFYETYFDQLTPQLGSISDIKLFLSGIGKPAIFGRPGPLIGGATALGFIGDQTVFVTIDGDGSPDALNHRGSMTIECWVRIRNPLWTVASLLGDGGYFWDLSMTDTRKLQFFQFNGLGPFGFEGYQSPFTVPADTWTHVAVTRDVDRRELRWFLNGVEQSPRQPFAGPPLEVMAGGNFKLANTHDWDLAHVAVFYEALPPERIAQHYASKFDQFEPMATGAYLGAILDSIGWPAGERQIDTGNSTIKATPAGNALDNLLSAAEDSEGGIFQVIGDGKLLFHERHALWKSPHTTSQATFGDSGAELPYADISNLEYDDKDLFPRVRVEHEDGRAAEASNATAVTKYGPRTLSRSGVKVASYGELIDAANYWVKRYKTPLKRIAELSLIGAGDDDVWAQILDADTHHRRITVRKRPPGGGAVIELVCHIEGLEHVVIPPARWTTKLHLVPADPEQFWLLGDSTYGVLGTSTRLGW